MAGPAELAHEDRVRSRSNLTSSSTLQAGAPGRLWGFLGEAEGRFGEGRLGHDPGRDLGDGGSVGDWREAHQHLRSQSMLYLQRGWI